MCSDRLDADFPDIDLSQLDTSDFDSVNCLSELQWCNDQPVDASPASIHYSPADELFEVRLRPQKYSSYHTINLGQMIMVFTSRQSVSKQTNSTVDLI